LLGSRQVTQHISCPRCQSDGTSGRALVWIPPPIVGACLHPSLPLHFMPSTPLGALVYALIFPSLDDGRVLEHDRGTRVLSPLHHCVFKSPPRRGLRLATAPPISVIRRDIRIGSKAKPGCDRRRVIGGGQFYSRR